MKRLFYVEHKTGQSDRGRAWIGFGDSSKTGRTIYFNDRAFQSCKGSGIGANYFDVESKEQFWISGIKKNGADRHWAGGGPVMIERAAIGEYLLLRNLTQLDPAYFEVVDLTEGNVKSRINALLNNEENTAAQTTASPSSGLQR